MGYLGGRRAISENLGVNAEWILRVFYGAALDICKEMETPNSHKPGFSPNFHQIAAAGYFHGPNAMGANLICPRDGKLGCSVVDALDQQRIDAAGAATHFLSWVWSYTLEVFHSGV